MLGLSWLGYILESGLQIGPNKFKQGWNSGLGMESG